MRAKTFEDLRTQISHRYGDLPGRLRQIAEFALHRPNDMALGTVATIAEQAGVQPSSIIRFAHSFGFEGFSDMQTLFRSRLVAGASTYRDRIAALGAGRGSGPSALLGQFVNDGIAALEALHESTSEAHLSKTVRILERAAEVYVIAQKRSFPVAFYLHYGLNRLDRRSHLVDGVGGVADDQIRLIASRDALVAVSFKDYAPEVVAAAKSCAARKVPVIAITDSPLSPVARAASVAFIAADDVDQPFRSLVAPICLAQTLIVAYGQHLESRPS